MPQGPRLAVPAPPRKSSAVRAIALAVMVVSACLGASGCGGDDSGSEPDRGSDTGTTPEAPPTLSAARVESAVKKALDGIELFAIPTAVYPSGGGPPQQSQLGGGRLKVRSVTCPPNVPLERGGTFTCELDAGDNDGTVRLRQLKRSGSPLSYKASIEPSDAGAGLPVKTELKGKIKLK